MNETQESFIIVVLESDGVVFVTNRGSKRKNERERERERSCCGATLPGGFFYSMP